MRKQPTIPLKERKRFIATEIFKSWKPFTDIGQSFHDEIVRLYADKTPASIARGNELNGALCDIKDKCSDASERAFTQALKNLSNRNNTRELREFGFKLCSHLRERYEHLLHFRS